MTGVRSTIAVATLTCAVSSGAWAQSSDQLTPHKVKISAVDYQGKHAVKIVEDGTVGNGEAYAIVAGPEFHDGTIDVQIAGRPAAGVGEGARGFIGIAFRLRGERFEYVYLRPTNGPTIKSGANTPAVQHVSRLRLCTVAEGSAREI